MRSSDVPNRKRNGSRGQKSHQGNGLTVRVAEGATEAMRSVRHSVRHGARSAAKRVRETAGEITEALRTTLQEETEDLYERHKGTAVSQVKQIGRIADQAAHALHAVKADTVAQYLDRTADRLEDAVSYLKESDLPQLLHDGGRMIRRNRGLAMGGMFVAGYVLARFLKATAEDSSSHARPRRRRSR